MDYCTNCGKELNGASFCTNCGTPANPAEGAAPSDGAGTYTPDNDTNFAPAGGSSSGIDGKKIGIIAVLVAAVIAACFLIFGGVNSSPKSVVKAMVKYTYNSPNAKKVSKLVHKKIVEEQIDEEYDGDKKKFYKEGKEDLEDVRDEFKDEYGKNAKAKVKINSVKKVKDDTLEKIQEYYEDEYDLKVKAAKTVKYKLTLSGKDKKDSQNVSLTVVKINGKWYMDNSGAAYFSSDDDDE